MKKAKSVLILFLLTLGVPGAFAAEVDDDGETKGPEMAPEARILGNPDDDCAPYTFLAPSATARQRALRCPWRDQFGRPYQGWAPDPPRPSWLGEETSRFMAYGDLRVAFAYNDNGVPGRNGKTHQSRIATRLNLDLDFSINDTSRIHAFVRPFDDNGNFLRYDIDGRIEGESFEEFDFEFETLYFEGDLGNVPVAVGLIPILTQNGVWIEDAFEGVAFSIKSKNGAERDVGKMDLTFFVGFNKVTTDAVATDDDAHLYGVAGFVDTLAGYLEFGYGYVDADTDDLGYHNVTAAFSRRFGNSVSNSVRVIGNFGQDPVPGRFETADGVLVLVENSFITSKPKALVPYLNLFAGFDTPQSLARTRSSGGVLRNTGINFESDGLTGYPTLDARGHDAYGGAVGVECLFHQDRQIVIEAALVERIGTSVLGSEYALGIRFQEPLSNAWVLRLDAMAGFRDDPLQDILGVRLEIRRKF